MFTLEALEGIAPLVWAYLAFAALLAGFLDAVVGGGGMVLVPALFTALPRSSASMIFGTNKLAGVFGTALATKQYVQKISLPWGLVLSAACAAFFAAILGAKSVAYLPTEQFRKALPFVLLLLLLYTIYNQQLGLREVSPKELGASKIKAIVLGATLGFYDGVFGPGTGSFLVFAWVKFFGFEFLKASASAKVVNLLCNLGALVWFVGDRQVIVWLSLWMALFTLTGAWVGSRMAIKNGAVFIRKIFIVVVSLLILRTAYDAYFKAM